MAMTTTDLCITPESESVCHIHNMDRTTETLQGIASEKTRQVFELVVLVALNGAVCLFGVGTNIINIIVFYKQGLSSTINISFFALAFSDLGTVTTSGWMSILFNQLVIDSVPQWDTNAVAYLSGGWPFFCFGRTTCWITAYVTAERCLCIAMPLKVKQIVTPRRATVIICFLYFINLAPIIPLYLSKYLDWVHVSETNQTLLTMAARPNHSVLEPVAFALHAFLGTASFPVVILFTTVLVFKLRRQRTWRMKSSTNQDQKTIASQREFKTMKMVVLIALVLISSYTPGILGSLVASFVPEFKIVGVEKNMYLIVSSIVLLFQALNSSVNIFMYYNMSTKYKQTFWELFSCQKDTVTGVGSSPKELCHEDE